MGITGELVRIVFSKSRSARTHDTNVMKSSSMGDRKKWKSSVKAYLCGDEQFDSVLAEEDSASVKSSEVTVTQPVLFSVEDLLSTNNNNTNGEDSISTAQSDEESDQTRVGSDSDDDGDENRDAAATVIQAAFRGFMVRRLQGSEDGFLKGVESPSRESLATSVEVQTGGSVVVSLQEGAQPLSNKAPQKPKQPPVFKPKENWDDSTVDSSVSKMRNQHRLEAMTRRERALAYAFSQQLRICSKKKPNKSEGIESNMGWSWLERWMATRQPEASSDEVRVTKVPNESVSSGKTRAILKKKFLDLSFEEKESCGSNEVPVQKKDLKNREREGKDSCKTVRNRLKATRNISRRKTVPTCLKEQAKVSRREGAIEANSEKKHKVKRTGSKREAVQKDASSLSSPEHSIAGQKSELQI